MARKKPSLETPAPPETSAEPPPAPRGAVTAEGLTLAEAAAFLRVPPAEVLSAVNAQGLPGRKMGEDWRFFKSALQTWPSATAVRKGLLSQIGALKDDPHREEMLAEVYKRRGRPETGEL